MTNDFAVVDQQQQTRKSPLLPVIGLTGGAWAGYAIANKKGAQSHQDLINEVRDMTDFSNKENKDVWQSVKDKIAEVDELQRKFDAASSKTVTGKELDELNAAKEALQKEIERLQALEGDITQTVGGINNKKGFMSFEKARNKFGKDAIPEYYVNDAGKVTKKKIPLTEVEKLYADLVQKSKDAYEKALNGISEVGEKNNALTAIEDVYKQMETDLNAEILKSPKRAESLTTNFYSNRTYINPSTGDEVMSKGYRRCFDYAKKQIPDYPKAGLKDADIVEIGREYKFGEKLQPGEKTMSATVKNAKGNSVTKTYVVTLEDMREMRSRRIAEIKEQRTELADQLFGNASRARSIQAQRAVLDTTGWVDYIDHGTAKQTGYLSKVGKTESLDVNKMIMEAGTNAKGEIDCSVYRSDIKAMEKMLKNPASFDATIVGKYHAGATAADVKEAIEVAQARKSVVTQYLSKSKSLEKEYSKCLSDNSVVTKLEEKITEKVSQNKNLARINKKLAAQFPGIFGDAETAVTKAGKTVTADDVAKSFRDRVADAQKAYDKAISERGAVNEEAKKAAEEALNKGKNELDNLVGKLGKAGGTKGKIIGAIIGAAAGCGLLWLIAPKKSKNT